MSAWKRIGGFWKKTSGSGKKFLSGEVTCPKCEAKTKITCWPNDKGDNPKRPDFAIYLSEDAAPKPEISDADDSAFSDSEMPF